MTVYQVFVMKENAQDRTKMIISTFIHKKTNNYPAEVGTLSIIAITLRYDFALSHNAFILSRIVITNEIYSKIIGKVFANGWRRKFLF
jgi:hypothetical protein